MGEKDGRAYQGETFQTRKARGPRKETGCRKRGRASKQDSLLKMSSWVWEKCICHSGDPK